MKKLTLVLAAIIGVSAIWYGESRKFFCLDNGSCVTVWKTYNNRCYIIPGKYYGIVKPSDNFIETSNTNLLTIYFTSVMPKGFIYKSEEPIKVYNGDPAKTVFYNFDSNKQKFDSILYPPTATKNSDIRDNARLMDVFILENYALDKNGKHL